MDIYLKLPPVLQDIIKEYHEETRLYLLSIRAGAIFSDIQHAGHILSCNYGLRSKHYKNNNKIYSSFHRLQTRADAYIYNNFKNTPFFVLNEMKNINPDNIFYCFKSCMCGYRRKGKLNHSLSNREKKEILNIYTKLKGILIEFNVYEPSKQNINFINGHVSTIEAFLKGAQSIPQPRKKHLSLTSRGISV